MPETRWTTLNHEVPNDGVPPGRMFASAIPQANPGPQGNAPPAQGPPNGGLPVNSGEWGPAPPAYNVSNCIQIPYIGRTAPAISVTVPSGSPSTGMMGAFPGYAPPRPTTLYSRSLGPPYEPPGQYVDGQIMHGNGWSYLTPANNTMIHFVGGGVRPCDWPSEERNRSFQFSRHKAACSMTVRELMNRLGCPGGDTKGITEIREAGSGSWVSLDTFTQGGESSRQTLEQVGWTSARNEQNAVWLVVKG